MSEPRDGRSGPAAEFDCLWCGRPWSTRGPDDLEGWARLCPDCLGKAGDNEFLRFRLRTALEARARAGSGGGGPESPAPDPVVPAAAAPADAELDRETAASADAELDRETAASAAVRTRAIDDWYLRRGRFERGPVHDAAWHAELDAAGRWLDGLPLAGRIVELAAGTGWWSPLLAGKGELSAYDAFGEALDQARDRLLAHRLRAHLHVRDAWAEPEPPPADGLFFGFWLSRVRRERTVPFLVHARRWLKPGGRLALIDSLGDPQAGAADEIPPGDDPATRRPADGSEVTAVAVHRQPAEIRAALEEAGFAAADARSTGRFFVLATATA